MKIAVAGTEYAGLSLFNNHNGGLTARGIASRYIRSNFLKLSAFLTKYCAIAQAGAAQ